MENNAECALDMLLVAALLLLVEEVPTGASADRQDGGWEKANAKPDGQHDELATAAAAMATAITDVLFDDMNGPRGNCFNELGEHLGVSSAI